MNIGKKVLGIFLIIVSVLALFLIGFSIMTGKEITDTEIITSVVLLIFLILGIVAACDKSPDRRKDRQEYEEFLRMKEQERRVLYRNADYQCKSIDEYLMDDRTKLVTYYDRMPQSYKSKLVSYAETLYRNFENEEFMKSK